MKTLIRLFITIIALAIGCKEKTETQLDKNKSILLDSVVTNGRHITIVHAKDTLRPIETMNDFKDNPNITKTDINAGEKIQSKEVQYVKPGILLKVTEGDSIRKVK